MKICYAVPHDFPPELLEELREVVDRSLPEYPNQCHGGVTIGGVKYYFSYEVRDGVADLSLRRWSEVEAALNKSGISLIDLALPPTPKH